MRDRTETFSDHRLVVMSYEDNWTKLYKPANKKRDDTSKRFNTEILVNDPDTRKKYQERMNEKVEEVNTWEELQTVFKEVAEEVIGYNKPQKNQHERDNEIDKLSNIQKDIRMSMMIENNPVELQQHREKRKRVQKEIQQKLATKREEEIDKIVNDVKSAKDDVKMFKAVRNMKRKRFENPTVHDKENKNVTTPDQVYKIIEEYFKDQFYKNNETVIERHKGPPKALNRPISGTEIIKTIQTMSNNKAYVNIPVELMKYAPTTVHRKTAEILNNIFEKHVDIDTGSAILVPLQKPPPKKKGPVKNLRPINLLPVIRKVLSKLALRRSEPNIEKYLSKTQAAYRKGRSTSEIVWAYRWLLAKIQEYEMTIYVTGIDMSSAFDTIHRDELLNIAEKILDEDGARILRILLSNTSIEIRVKGAKTKPVKTNIGGPQGDSYSGPQFTTYFENTLKEVRTELGINLEEMVMPEEMIYADDYDNLTTEQDKQKRFIDEAPKILQRHNLKVNETKTEETILRRNKHDRKNKMTNEPWRETVKLGSKLGDREDMKYRKQLATGSMKKMEEILKRHRVVNRDKRLKLYNAIVRSVLMYNSCTWGMSVTDEKEIDSFHRKQLRIVLGVRYPTTMRNKIVYEQSKSKPLSVEITKSRWKTHITHE